MKSATDFDIFIVGGGLVGAALALALRDSGLRLALVERGALRPPPGDDWDARIYAVTPANIRALQRLGGWPRLDASRLAPVHAMEVWGDDGGRIEFNADRLGVPALAVIAESRLILDGLWARLRESETVHSVTGLDCSALTWEAERVRLRLTDGAELSARLVVGADGRDSWVRNQAGVDIHPHSYRQKGVVANFATEKPHGQTARQWFMPDGVLAYLPLPGNRISIVWSAEETKAQALTALAPDAFCAEVAAAGRHALGALRLITPPAAFPLRRLNIGSLVRPRLALVGDAAHNVHPLAGQGVNLGFQDAWRLAETLHRRGAHRDCGDYHLLRRYDRARQEDILAMQIVTEGLQRLFNNRDPLLGWARNLGLSTANRLTGVKHLLARRALGTG